MDANGVLTRGVESILPSKEGLEKLMSSRRIKIYQGFDPSMPSLHLGHLAGLIKLRQFQKLGHEVIFLIGDFTGMIGDPTDKVTTRKKLSREDVLKNAEKWKEQIGRILAFEGDNPAKILYNSEWNDKKTFKDLIEITSTFTIQQLIERDMYQKRLKSNEPIYLHEFLYPVAQAIDSIEMDVDLEIGGSDQIFNMLAGRSLMRTLKSKEKYILATKLLVDKEGNKVGKTTGNALFFDTIPEEFYAGIMSFPDEVTLAGFELLTELDLSGLEEKIKNNPMEEKKGLAFQVVKGFWDEESAKRAQENFERIFQERKPEYNTQVEAKDSLATTIAPYTSLGSISEAKRLIGAGAVEVGGKVVKDTNYKPQAEDEIKVGKKTFLKVK